MNALEESITELLGKCDRFHFIPQSYTELESYVFVFESKVDAEHLSYLFGEVITKYVNPAALIVGIKETRGKSKVSIHVSEQDEHDEIMIEVELKSDFDNICQALYEDNESQFESPVICCGYYEAGSVVVISEDSFKPLLCLPSVSLDTAE